MTYCTIYYPKLPLQSKVTAEKVRIRKKDQIKIGQSTEYLQQCVYMYI